VPGATNAWSVGLVARTGGQDDLSKSHRLTVTLRVRNTTAHLNIQGWPEESENKPPAAEIDPDMYDWIFVQKKSFSLELYVDRVGRKGIAELHAGRSMKREFDFADDFVIADSEPITVLGATLANCCSHGQHTSVEIKDFEIWAE
jgi:hypothetical protein